LMGPIFLDLSNDVIISAHSNLYGFSFSSLLTEKPLSYFDYKTYPYVFKEKDISRCSDLFSFLKLKSKQSIISGGVLGFAPLFNDSTENLGLSSLAYNVSEVNSAVAQLGGLELLTEKANMLELKKHISEYDIVHFSTHAVYDSLKQYSDLLYRTRNGKVDKIDLTQVEDIYSKPRLIVLGGCKTSLSITGIGEGYQGLNNRLFDKGINGVISTDWNTNDYSSFKLNEIFYSKLGKGSFVRKSLWESKIQYLNEMPNELCHPYYWAGLNYLGNPDLKYASFGNKISNLFLAIFIILLLMVILIRARK